MSARQSPLSVPARRCSAFAGATISGPQVAVVEIAQPHLLVQTNTKSHDSTVEEVRKLTEAPNDSSTGGGGVLFSVADAGCVRRSESHKLPSETLL